MDKTVGYGKLQSITIKDCSWGYGECNGNQYNHFINKENNLQLYEERTKTTSVKNEVRKCYYEEKYRCHLKGKGTLF